MAQPLAISWQDSSVLSVLSYIPNNALSSECDTSKLSIRLDSGDTDMMLPTLSSAISPRKTESMAVLGEFDISDQRSRSVTVHLFCGQESFFNCEIELS